MVDPKSKEWMIEMLNEELSSNLRVLIDPKRKDSFSQPRIQTWKELVSERIYHHLTNQNKNQTQFRGE